MRRQKETSLSSQYSLSRRQNIENDEEQIQGGHLCQSTWDPQTGSLTRSIIEDYGSIGSMPHTRVDFEGLVGTGGHLCHSTWGPQTGSLTMSITDDHDSTRFKPHTLAMELW